MIFLFWQVYRNYYCTTENYRTSCLKLINFSYLVSVVFCSESTVALFRAQDTAFVTIQII